VVAALRAAGCVFAEDEAELLIAAAGSPAELAELVEQRTAGTPLEYVLGWVQFAGLRIAVDPGVFVPRRRTELLVQQALALLHQADCATTPAPMPAAVSQAGPVVVDLCCGTGAVGAAMAAARRIELHAVDLDPVAVRCARRNLAATGARVYQGDLYRPLPRRLRGRVDLVVANAPYVPTAALEFLPPEARLHEPRLALDGGADGLAVLRRVAAQAPRWLADGGHLLVEAGRSHVAELAAALAGYRLQSTIAKRDDLDATVLIATNGPVPVPDRL
jgi:release factor glutamine methyltransferase